MSWWDKIKGVNWLFLFILLGVVAAYLQIILHFCNVWEYSVVGEGSFISACIAIVGILIVFVVGWQIINAMEIKDRLAYSEQMTYKGRNDIEKTAIDIKRQNQKLRADTNWAIADMYYALLENDLQKKRNSYIVNKSYQYIKYTLLAIKDLAHTEDFTSCNLRIKGLLEIIPTNTDIRLSESEYKDILTIEGMIPKNNLLMPQYIDMIRRINILDPNNQTNQPAKSNIN